MCCSYDVLCEEVLKMMWCIPQLQKTKTSNELRTALLPVVSSQRISDLKTHVPPKYEIQIILCSLYNLRAD